tara:strand:+ start:10202 stop:10312 length:111 start_codon:yes stop_codon:yes gene_type:complete
MKKVRMKILDIVCMAVGAALIAAVYVAPLFVKGHTK